MKKSTKLLAAVFAATAVLSVSVIAGTARSDARIPKGVMIGGTDVSGMTEKEAQQEIDHQLQMLKKEKLTFVAEGHKVKVAGKELGLSVASEELIKKAMNAGKKGNLIERFRDKETLEKGGRIDLPLSLRADEPKVKKCIEKHRTELDTQTVNNSLTRENDSFVFKPGKSGYTVLTEQSTERVAEFISDEWDGTKARIALVTKENKPQGTKEELETIKDELGSFETNYSGSTEARSTNIKNGASKISGNVLMPGESFSVAEALNPMTAENGYAPAPSYENGQTVDTYGGGVCQVSTTLYNAVIRAELEVEKRYAHSMIVKYVEPSMDAAIAGDTKDFVFKNNQKTPIFIEGSAENGIIRFAIYGKETRPENRTVTFESEIINREEPTTVYEATNDPIGTVKQKSSAHTGYTARLMKIVTLDGKEESKDVFNESVYRMQNTVIAIGTNSSSASASAAVSNAVATQDYDTILAVVNSNLEAAAEQRARAAEQEAAKQQQSQGSSADAAAVGVYP